VEKNGDADDAPKTLHVDREIFENALRKMLQSPPTSKAKISQKIKALGYRPLKPPPKRP
jgi:hypothetical protein